MNKIVYTDTIDQVYFSMGDIAEELGITTSLLRYWCDKLGFLCLRRSGKRFFTQEDKGVLIITKHLIQVQLFTIEGARQELKKMNLKIYHSTV